MRIDGIQLTEGSNFRNATIDGGTGFPAMPNPGELYFRTDANALFARNNANWVELAAQSTITAHMADDTRHLTTSQNTLLDGITVSFTDVNQLAGVTSNIQSQFNALNVTVADAGIQLNNISNYNVLSRDEKPDVKLEWERMFNEQPDILAKAAGLGITGALIQNYTTAITTLDTYLSSLGPNQIWTNFGVDTIMIGDSLATYRRNFYFQRQLLLNAMIAKAGQLPLTSTIVPSTNIDLTNKLYVDNMDYLNLNPKAGMTSGDSTVPVYSDFKFSLGTGGTSALTLVDSESKQVVYFNATTPTTKQSMFRAYRFSDNDSFVFDNDAISAAFLNANERVGAMLNAGTNFVVLQLVTITYPTTTTRIAIARTDGSSRWQDWTFAYDVLPQFQGSMLTNWSLIQDPVFGDRILQVVYDLPGAAYSDLRVYDSTLTLLRTQRMYSQSTDVCMSDLTGAGRTAASISVGYYPYGFGHGFTWNPFTETFHQKNAGYYNGKTSAGQTYGQNYALSISWVIPRSWIMSGTGTPSNLIPVKTSGFRYHAYQDSTWDADDGGMSTAGYGNAGNAYTITTDEYSGQVCLSTKGTWSYSDIGNNYVFAAGRVYKTFGSSLLSSQLKQIGAALPDGSAWSKMINPGFTQVIDNQISFVGTSVRFGTSLITTTFSTTSFNSAYIANDTFKLDAANAKLFVGQQWPTDVSSSSPGNFGTVVVAGVPNVHWTVPGKPIYIASASGTTRTYALAGYTIPAIPSTVSGITGLTYRGTSVWNGSTSAPVVWAIVGNATKYYVAKLVAGAWSIVGTSVYDAAVAAGMAARGDGLATASIGESATLLTQNGRWMIDLVIPYPGAQSFYSTTFDINTNTMVVNTWNKFASINAGKPGGYVSSTGYSGSAYGYSTTLGYYAIRSTAAGSSSYFLSSKDPRGVGGTFTEDQWFAGNSGRYETFISCESATGLVAYLSEYPIFLGGYFTKIPTTTLTLLPNTVNYVYATKDSSDRTTVNVTTSTGLLPNSFSRMRIAAITTNATSIVSSTVYSFDGIVLPAQEGKAGQVLKTDGSVTFWAPAAGASPVNSVAGKIGDVLLNGADISAPRNATASDLGTAKEIRWKNFGASHTIFDASAGTTPTGAACSQTDATNAWQATYPTLMGYNGSATYGVRVDSAKKADTATSASFATSAGTANSATVATTASTAGNTSSISMSLGNQNTWTGTQFFQSNKGGGSYLGASGVAFTLEASSSDAGAAAMTFIRSGQYAVNIGLDPDNFFRIGGYSAAANRLQMDMSGNLTMAGNITAYSDERLKRNWLPLPGNFVGQWAQVKHGVFERIDSGETQVGLSAQGVNKILPWAVSEMADGYLTVNYGAAAGVATVALAQEVVELKAQLQQQGDLIKMLMKKIGY